MAIAALPARRSREVVAVSSVERQRDSQPTDDRAGHPYLARRSREVVAVSGWRLGTAERQRMRCHRIPTQDTPTLTRWAEWAEWRGVLKNANTLSMPDQLTLTPGSFRA